MAEVKTAVRSGIDAVRRAVRAGVSLSGAVKDVLDQRGLSINKLAIARGVSRTNLSSVLTGRLGPTERDLQALADEIGGTVEDWRDLCAGAVRRRLDAPLTQAANQ